MASPSPALYASSSTETDKQRADKLAAAKRRLRTFRAARGSDTEPLSAHSNVDNIPRAHARERSSGSGSSGDKPSRKGVRTVYDPSPLISPSQMLEDGSSDEVLQAATSRLATFSFGAKPQTTQPVASSTSSQPLLPSLALVASRRPRPLSASISLPAQDLSSLALLSRPPSLVLTQSTPVNEHPPQPTTPPRRERKRHSHTRSTSISIPPSRPQSLAAYPSSPGLSPAGVVSSPRRLTFGPSGRGAEADKERARASAFASLEGGRQPHVDTVALPQFDDDEPPALAFGAPKPFAWTEPAAMKSDPMSKEPHVWDPETPDDLAMPDFSVPTTLGSVAEEEEDEEDAMTAEVKTTPGLKELHLLSTTPTSTNPVRVDDPPAPFQTPTKGYGTIGRGRPRPLSGINLVPSPSTPSGTTPTSARRRGGSKSSISYVRDGSTSSGEGSRDHGRSVVSPPTSISIASPLAWSGRPARPCPRPRSLASIAGRGAGRVLGEVDEEAEDGSPLKRASFTTTEDSDTGEPSAELHGRLRDTEMERDSLREDVEGWRHRCKALEDRLDAEKRGAMVLRDRVRKLGDRLSSISSTNPAAEKPSSKAEADAFAKAQGRLLTEMRDQLFSLAAALDAERGAKNEAIAAMKELKLERNAEREVWQAERDAWLGREPAKRLSRVTTVSSSFSLGSISSGCAPPVRIVSGESEYPVDPEEWSKPGLVPLQEEEEVEDYRASVASTESSIPVITPNSDQSASRMKIWGFPRGAVARSPHRRESIYDSFFSLPSVVEPVEEVVGVGVELPPIPSPLLPAKTNPFTPARSTSFTMPASATTSALSFLAGYLPSARTPSPEVPKSLERETHPSGSFGSQTSSLLRRSSTSRTKRFISASDQPMPLPSPIDCLDFTGGCRHCANAVFEL